MTVREEEGEKGRGSKQRSASDSGGKKQRGTILGRSGKIERREEKGKKETDMKKDEEKKRTGNHLRTDGPTKTSMGMSLKKHLKRERDRSKELSGLSPLRENALSPRTNQRALSRESRHPHSKPLTKKDIHRIGLPTETFRRKDRWNQKSLGTGAQTRGPHKRKKSRPVWVPCLAIEKKDFLCHLKMAKKRIE